MAKATALRDLTIPQLEKKLLHMKSKLEEMKREKLLQELNQVDEQIRGLTEAGKGGGAATAAEGAAPRRGRPKGSKNKTKGRRRRVKGQKALKHWVQEELGKAKKGLTIDELITNIQANGYQSKSDKFKNVMYQCLFHGEGFQRDAESGRWVLVAQ